jgi:hypothetical protein
MDITRRSLLGLLSSLPLVGVLKPKPADKLQHLGVQIVQSGKRWKRQPQAGSLLVAVVGGGAPLAGIPSWTEMQSMERGGISLAIFTKIAGDAEVEPNLPNDYAAILYEVAGVEYSAAPAPRRAPFTPPEGTTASADWNQPE